MPFVRRRHFGSGALSATLVAALAVACGGEGPPKAYAIRFSPRVGSAAFACDETFDALGATHARVAFGDFRLYVHDVRLVSSDGREVALALDEDGTWQHAGIALLDFESGAGTCRAGTPATNRVVRGKAPSGDYVGVAFTIGVPESMNHTNAASSPPPLDQTSLFWEWTSGYTFLRVDGTVAGAQTDFIVHIAAGGCSGNPALGEQASCKNPNLARVRVTGLDLDEGAVALDLGALLAGIDLEHDAGGAAVCMSDVSDPECALVFTHLGLDLSHGTPLPHQSFAHAE
jgi:uncharacterized repeat protein (TIGR04052 family)